MLWRYTDNEHFYSFIVKPDGWELAKQDATYPGKQRFLAYSYARSFPTGAAYRVRVRHVDEHHDGLGQRRPSSSATRTENALSGREQSRSMPEDSSVRYGPLELRPLD